MKEDTADRDTGALLNNFNLNYHDNELLLRNQNQSHRKANSRAL